MHNGFMRVDDVASELGVSKSYAYRIVKRLNDELKEMGYLTISGRISRKYFMEKLCYNGSEKMERKGYHTLFDEALERYNAKQKRADRLIDNYYEKIRTGKQAKLFHEVILQIGNKDNMAAVSGDGQLAAKVLDEYMQDLETRVSLKQALAEQGFAGGARGDTEWGQWVRSEKEQLSRVMERHDIEWEQLGTHDEHLSVMNYKKEQRVQEVKTLEKSIVKLQKQQLDVQAVEQIDVKNVPLSSKVMLEKEDYQTLVTAAQKYVVQVKRESKLERLLAAAEKTIAGLKQKISELTRTVASLKKQLDEYRSVRGQLDRGKLQSENTELRKQNSVFKTIIEQHDLGHLLGRNRNQRNERDTR